MQFKVDWIFYFFLYRLDRYPLFLVIHMHLHGVVYLIWLNWFYSDSKFSTAIQAFTMVE